MISNNVLWGRLKSFSRGGACGIFAQCVAFCFIGWLYVDCFADQLFQERMLVLKDADGQTIDNYCLAPIYVRFYDRSIGDRDIEFRYFLMWPTSLEKADGFEKIKTTDAVAFPVFNSIGQVIGISKPMGDAYDWSTLLFLKRGYKPLVWKHRAEAIYPKTLLMEKGNSESELTLLLSSNKTQEQLQYLFQTSGVEREWEIVDRYTDADKELLRKCYYEEEQ